MIGNKIKTLRLQKGIDSKLLVDRMDIDLSTLNCIENDKIGSFKPDFLLKIANELDATIAELFDQASNVAIQHNEQGQNINVLNKQIMPPIESPEEVKKLWQETLNAKDQVIQEKEYVIAFMRSQFEALQERIDEVKNGTVANG